MKDIIISIIVPVYNAEKYIERMLCSVADQLTEEIELLLVNDGSTDNSGKICDEYANNNPFIHVIHQENGGPSVARNAGIRAARGEYITFIDADDYVEAGTYSAVMKVIQGYRPDCIDFGWRYVSRTGETSCSENKIPKAELLGRDFIKSKIIPTLLNIKDKNDGYFVYDFIWNKLFRRDKMMANGVEFPKARRTWEDRLVVLSYLYHCENYYSMAECFYNYVNVPNSNTKEFDIDRLNIIVDNYRIYKKMGGKEYDFDTEYANSYWVASIDNMIKVYLQQKEQRQTIKETVRAVLKEEEVKLWFRNRKPKDEFEKETGALIAAGDVDRAIECYEKKIAKDRRRASVRKVKYLIRRGLGKIIRAVKKS